MKANNFRALPRLVCAGLFAIGAVTTAWANVIVNPGFELDAVLDARPVPGASGWTTFGVTGDLANTVSANRAPTRSGIGAMQLVGLGDFGITGAFQTFAAAAGQTWDLSGYMLTRSALPAGATSAILKIVWTDGTNDLMPESADIGTINFYSPGIESVPTLNSGSTPFTWHFTQARGVAPAGTTQVRFFALLVDESPVTVYFDDISAVPEPAGAAMLLLGLAGIGAHLKRQRA